MKLLKKSKQNKIIHTLHVYKEILELLGHTSNNGSNLRFCYCVGKRVCEVV